MSSPAEPVVLVASAEFTLKSSPVRRTLEQRLLDDLRTELTRAGFDGFSVQKHAARVVIRGLRETASAAHFCSKVFGVAYAAPAFLLPASMEDVTQTIVRLAKQGLEAGQSFAIRSHRSTPSSLSRRDIEVLGGAEVLRVLKDRAVKVNLENPDVTIFVDLADDRAYVYREKLHGPGGLPLSSQWRMLAPLESGPLTILAAYAMMRRGCLVELLIPVSESIPQFSKEYQLNLARKLREFVTRPNYRAFILDFGALISDRSSGHSLGYTASRYLVRRAAVKFAETRRFRGIIFSDVAGEVRSKFGAVRSESVQLPVFHPLIGLDVEDLLEMCRLTSIPVEDIHSQVNLENDRSDVFDDVVFAQGNLNEASVRQISL